MMALSEVRAGLGRVWAHRWFGCPLLASLSSVQNPSPLCFHAVAKGNHMCWYSSRAAKRLEKLGIDPDGKPLPTPNSKKIFPRLYKVLLVNQDGSTNTIHHRYPHSILTLPLDPSTLTEEERAERERRKQAAQARVYVEDEEMEEEDAWDQSKYRDLIDK